MNLTGYSGDLSNRPDILALDDVDLSQGTRRLSEVEHKLREDIIGKTVEEIGLFLETQYFFRRIRNFNDLPQLLNEDEGGDVDAWDHEAEGYDIPIDVDGDPSEIRVLGISPFESNEEGRAELRNRMEVASERHKSCDVIIEAGEDGWYAYTPASAEISKFELSASESKGFWLGSFILRRLEERIANLNKIGELLIRCIKSGGGIDLDDSLSGAGAFTTELIVRNLKIHKSTVSRISNARFSIPGTGELTLGEILSRSRTGDISHKVKGVIENEDRRQPMSDPEIGRIVGKTGRQIGNIRKQLNIMNADGRLRQYMERDGADSDA